MSLVRKLEALKPAGLAGLMLLVALAVTLVGHARAFSVADSLECLKTHDAVGIMDGYRQTPHLWKDGLRWWHGQWINEENLPYFRPLPSYVHWFQVHWYFHYGWAYLTLSTLALYALTATASGLVTKRFTGSATAGLLCTLAFSLYRFDAYGVPMDCLAWFPVVDNLMVLLFLAAAVVFFDKWSAAGKWSHYMAAHICVVLALLSKEYAYVFPLWALAIVMFRNEPAASRIKWKSVLPSILLVLFSMRWRSMVLPESTNLFSALGGALRQALSHQIHVAHESGIMAGLAAMQGKWALIVPFLTIAGCLGLTGYLTWRFRRNSLIALLCSFFLLAFAPLTMLDFKAHRSLFVVFWLFPLGVACALELLSLRGRPTNLMKS